MAERVESFYISNFMSQMKGFAHQNQFAVDINLPAALQSAIVGTPSGRGQSVTEKIRFAVKAASLPESEVGNIEVGFRGRKFKIPGDRTFNDWQTTIIVDLDFALRDAFEQWSDLVNGNVNHDQVDVGALTDLMGTADVHQLDRNGNVLKSVHLVGIWPSNVGAIELGWDENDSYETFPLTWKYQWWESETSTRNNTQTDSAGAVTGAPRF